MICSLCGGLVEVECKLPWLTKTFHLPLSHQCLLVRFFCGIPHLRGWSVGRGFLIVRHPIDDIARDHIRGIANEQ